MRQYLRAACACLFALQVTCARRPPDSGESDSGTGGSGGNGGSTAPTDAAVPFDRDLSEVSFNYDGPLDDGSIDRDGACAVDPVPALPAALDMYLMLDRSGTMGTDCDVGSSRTSPWCYSINALAGFFAAPTSNGIGVALGFTPHGSCTWTNAALTEQNCCTFGDCCAGLDDKAPDVIADLPGGLSKLIGELNVQIPNGTTSPLEAALRGLNLYMEVSKRSDRQMVGIVMTDGNPNGCSKDLGTLSSLLSAHRAKTGQLTFVIGMTGANYVALETLAVAGGASPHNNHCVAGGTTPCHYYDVGDGNPSAFIDALQQIQRSTVGCHFTMPTTDAGVVDPDTLAVEWSTPTDTIPTRLTRLAAVDDCGDGWYADPTNPGQFALCPTTCAVVQGKVQVQIDILAGCLGS